MSITRLQQARQLYAMGQRVRFQGGGRDASRGDFGSPSGSKGGGGNNDKPTMADVAGPKTTSSSPKGNDNDYNYKGPADLGVTTRTVNTIDAPEAKEFIGGVAYDVTPATKAIRERAKVKQAILNPTVKRNKIFDPISNSFIDPFGPTKQGPSLFDIALFALGPLGIAGTKGKTLASAISLGKRAKTGIDTVTSIADQFGFKNPINSMFNSFDKRTSKGTTSTNNNTDNGVKDDREGIATLENQAGNYNEYILLLQKLQSGNISESERNRYNVLKNTLGI
jgi:hypothetical protein